MKIREQLQKALLCDEKFNEILDTLKKRLKYFENIETFEVNISMALTFEVTTKNNKWETTSCSKFDYAKEFSITIENDYIRTIDQDVDKVRDCIIEDMINACQFAETYETVEAIKIDNSWNVIDKLLAWNENYAGIYYIEQECGEGWITIPTKPNVRTIRMVIANKING